MNFTLENYIVISVFLVSLTAYIQPPSPGYLKAFPLYFAWIIWNDFYFANPKNIIPHLTALTDIIEYSFFYYVLREIIQNTKMKKLILYIMVIMPVFALINIYVIQKNKDYNILNFSVYCLIAVSLCIYYYFELMRRAENQSLSKLPAFWIVTGLLFNNLCTFPVFALVTLMKKVPLVISMNIVNVFLVVTLFTCILISIGFLCRLKIRKSTL
jgi:hypothetical protein